MQTASSADLISDEPEKSRSHMQNGLDIEVLFGLNKDVTNTDMHMGHWVIEKLRSGIKNPVSTCRLFNFISLS